MTREQVRAFDQHAIDVWKIPGVVLMENAGLACAQTALSMLAHPRESRVCVFCGTGNNGGDGYVIARHLFNQGLHVHVVVLGDMAKVTGDDAWNAWVMRGAKGLLDQGIPENRPEGYWNNVSQCCGDAGVGDFFLSLAEATGDPAHGDFARHLGDYIMTEAAQDESGVRWVQAENRTQPDFVQAQTGWMQGAAGVGAFFLHLDGAAKGRAPRVRFPDTPW